MKSQRFNLEVCLTQHAKERMAQRSVTLEMLLDLVETGEIKYKDETRLWIFKNYHSRVDNLICIVALIENVLVIKTVMHHFQLET